MYIFGMIIDCINNLRMCLMVALEMIGALIIGNVITTGLILLLVIFLIHHRPSICSGLKKDGVVLTVEKLRQKWVGSNTIQGETSVNNNKIDNSKKIAIYYKTLDVIYELVQQNTELTLMFIKIQIKGEEYDGFVDTSEAEDTITTFVKSLKGSIEDNYVVADKLYKELEDLGEVVESPSVYIATKLKENQEKWQNFTLD